VKRLAPWLAAALSGCEPAPFALVGHDLGAADGARLNQPIVLAFNDAVDPGTVRGETVRVVRERDGARVEGAARAEGATVLFWPRLPVAADLSDVALQPGESYRVEVPGLPMLRTLRGLERGALARGASLPFSTVPLAAGTLRDAPPEQLFVDPVPGPPHLRDDAPRLPVLRRGLARLHFSEPLDPRAVARAQFRLKGPWHQDARPKDDPLLGARLIENPSRAGDPGGPMQEAVVELALPATLPAPLEADEVYEVWFDPGELRDLAGHSLVRRGVPQLYYVKLVVEQ